MLVPNDACTSLEFTVKTYFVQKIKMHLII